MRMDAAILRPDGSVVCECALSDVSHGGARLKLAHKPGAAPPDIDTTFILSLSRRGNLFRHCRLVWRRGDELGLRFVAPKKPDP